MLSPIRVLLRGHLPNNEIMWAAALVYGALIAMSCAPIWAVMTRFGRDGLISAILLGLIATATIVGAGVNVYDASALWDTMLLSLAGAVAGGVTWFGGRIGRAAKSNQSDF